MRKPGISALVIILACFSLISCSQEASQTGTLVLDIDSGISKGIQPISMDVSSYNVVIKNSSQETVLSRTGSTETSYTLSVVAGIYTAEVEALNSTGDVIGKGSASCTVKAEQTNSFSITVTEETGDGTFAIAIAADEGYTLSYSIKKASGAECKSGTLTYSEGIYSASETLENGFYTFTTTRTDTGKALKSDSIRIVKGKTTSYSATFSFLSNGTVTIVDEISKTPSITITLEDDTLKNGESLKASASVTGISNWTSYWSIDGVSLSEAGAYADLEKQLSGFEDGQHTITLFVTDGTVVWSESKTFSIESSAVDEDYFRFTATSGTVVISNSKFGTATDVNLEYTKDGKAWNDFVMETGAGDATRVTLNEGESVYLRAKNTNTSFAADDRNLRLFTTMTENNGTVSVGGNIMYLLDKTGESLSLNDYAFCYLFYSCTCLTDASALSLPATTLSGYCYSSMFDFCVNLTAGPELPATTLDEYCYKDMFSSCSSLKTAPVLPATTLAEGCCECMFQGCTKLTSTSLLPATTLASECYSGMFSGCSSLKTAPVLPAATLTENCYMEMFRNCRKLSSVTIMATNVDATDCLKNFLTDAGTEVTDPILYVKASMTENQTINANRGIMTIDGIAVVDDNPSFTDFGTGGTVL